MPRAVLVTLVMCSMPTVVPSQDLGLENVRIVDPARGEVTEGSIVVQDGTIVSVERSLPADFHGERIDLEGRWIIPGLVDMHTHSALNASPAGAPQMLGTPVTARLALHTGVTAFLDLFGLEDSIFAFRDSQRNNGAAGAAVFAAGPCLTATDGHCSQFGIPTRIVDSPADAVREIDALAPKQPDVVKVVYDHQSYAGRLMPTIDRETLEAVVASAQQHGLKTIVHVGTWEDMRHAVIAGAAAVTHTPSPDPVPPDLPPLMIERGTAHIPTLAVQTDFARIVDTPSILDSPLLVQVTSNALREAYRTLPGSQRAGQSLLGWLLQWQRSNSEAAQVAVKTLADAGVVMLTGTDAGNIGVFQRFSLHREMELFVDAGLSEWAALKAASTNAAAFLGERWGVAPGNEATLLVLDASPLEDIRNTQQIHAVIQRGAIENPDGLLRP